MNPWTGFLAALAVACQPVTDENGDGHRVLACLGDSNTCFGTPGECAPVRSWCSWLEEWMPAEEVVNLAWGGADACHQAGWLSMDRQYAASQALERPADVVILASGTTDYPAAPEAVAGCHEALLELAAADGVRVVVALLPPIPNDPGRTAHAEATNTLLQALEAPVADFWTGFDDPALFVDPIHLGDQGQLNRARVAALALLE